VVVLLLGAFIATIHLGARFAIPEIGAFRSRFHGARLRELVRERAARGRRDAAGGRALRP
jgi:hypothetical protein